jgi:hypothetical protein
MEGQFSVDGRFWIISLRPTIRPEHVGVKVATVGIAQRGLMCRRRLALAFNQKHMEVGGQRLDVKLPHHQCDLTSMVSGMVCQMLHKVHQSDLRCAKREHFSQEFVGYVIREVGLFFLDTHPL